MNERNVIGGFTVAVCCKHREIYIQEVVGNIIITASAS